MIRLLALAVSLLLVPAVQAGADPLGDARKCAAKRTAALGRYASAWLRCESAWEKADARAPNDSEHSSKRSRCVGQAWDKYEKVWEKTVDNGGCDPGVRHFWMDDRGRPGSQARVWADLLNAAKQQYAATTLNDRSAGTVRSAFYKHLSKYAKSAFKAAAKHEKKPDDDELDQAIERASEKYRRSIDREAEKAAKKGFTLQAAPLAQVRILDGFVDDVWQGFAQLVRLEIVESLRAGQKLHWPFEPGQAAVGQNSLATGAGFDGAVHGSVSWRTSQGLVGDGDVRFISGWEPQFLPGALKVADAGARQQLELDSAISVFMVFNPQGPGQNGEDPGGGTLFSKEGEYQVAIKGEDLRYTVAAGSSWNPEGWVTIFTDMQAGRVFRLLVQFRADGCNEFRTGREAPQTVVHCPASRPRPAGDVTQHAGEDEFWVGGRQDPDNPQWLNATIDEVAVWDRELTDLELDAIYYNDLGDRPLFDYVPE